jgi:hypothetical protein
MRKLLIALAVAGLASEASASLAVYEPFDYAGVGSTLEGNTNGTNGDSWVSAYGNAVAPSLINVSSGNLGVPAGMPAAIGNSVDLDGGPSSVATNPQQSGKSLRLSVGTGNNILQDSGNSIYYSMALRVDDLAGSTNVVGGFFAALNNSAGATTSNPSAAAAKLQMRIDPTDGTKYNIGIFRNVNATAAATSWSGPLTVGDTIFIVASYEAVSGTQNDIARLWINPASNTLGDLSFDPNTTTPTLIDNSTGTGTDIGIASIILRQSAAPHLTLDELRIGSTWADVTPVPEPAVASLLALVGAGAMARRRRNA